MNDDLPDDSLRRLAAAEWDIPLDQQPQPVYWSKTPDMGKFPDIQVHWKRVRLDDVLGTVFEYSTSWQCPAGDAWDPIGERTVRWVATTADGTVIVSSRDVMPRDEPIWRAAAKTWSMEEQEEFVKALKAGKLACFDCGKRRPCPCDVGGSGAMIYAPDTEEAYKKFLAKPPAPKPIQWMPPTTPSLLQIKWQRQIKYKADPFPEYPVMEYSTEEEHPAGNGWKPYRQILAMDGDGSYVEIALPAGDDVWVRCGCGGRMPSGRSQHWTDQPKPVFCSGCGKRIVWK